MENLETLKSNVETAKSEYNNAVKKFNASKTGMLKRGDKDLREKMVDAEIDLDKAKEALQEYYDENPDEDIQEDDIDLDIEEEKIEFPVIKQRGNIVPQTHRPIDLSKVTIQQKGKTVQPRAAEQKFENGDPVITQGPKKVIKSGSQKNRDAYKKA